jgi:AGZA family xanthine/uracil permease-like MFS transporter
MVIVLAWFGIISLMSALIPVVAIAPILLYIGMLIGSQAFQESPRRHAPAIILALVPSLAAWGVMLINNALAGAAGITEVTPDMIANMAQKGVLYHGLSVLGGGSILAGVVLGAVATFIIDREFIKAAGFALAGAVLTFFGFMHGETIGVAVTPGVAAAYLMVAFVLYGCHQFGHVTVAPPATAHASDEEWHPEEAGEEAVAAV